MNVIAKISCYFERSVVTLKLRKIFKYSDIQYTSLTPDKILNSLVYRTLFCVNIYSSFKISKKQSGFWPTLYITRFLLFLYFAIICALYSKVKG